MGISFQRAGLFKDLKSSRIAIARSTEIRCSHRVISCLGSLISHELDGDVHMLKLSSYFATAVISILLAKVPVLNYGVVSSRSYSL